MRERPGTIRRRHGERISPRHLTCVWILSATKVKVLHRSRPAESSSPDGPRMLGGNESVSYFAWDLTSPLTPVAELAIL